MEEIICSVCLDVINNDINHTITTCSHHFHSSCFARCCKINSCPNCRATLFDDIPTNTDDLNYENDFNFPPIPEVVLINDERFFIGSDGFIYANIECDMHDRVATIYDNYDNTYTYEWLNTLYYNMGRPTIYYNMERPIYTLNNERLELEDGEINDTSEEEDSTEDDADCLKKIEDELELIENIYFIPVICRL
jgi:hypothetical protein